MATSFEQNKPQLPQGQINIAVNTPMIYANAVMVGFSNSDMQLTTHFNGRPTSTIVMPLSAAKTLIEGLSRALTDYERRTETNVIGLSELTEKLNRNK